MTQYSSQEVDNRAKNLAAFLQARLTGVGIKSEVANNWYSYVLMVEDPEIYRAVSIHESVDKGTLLICFETIRLGTDGEILYRGSNIEENAGSFDDVVEEAKRQNHWAKRRVERRTQVDREHQLALDVLSRLIQAHPGYGIHITNESDCRFGMSIDGLTEARVEETIKFLEGAR